MIINYLYILAARKSVKDKKFNKELEEIFRPPKKPLEELQKKREKIVKRYIGTFNKPVHYYKVLAAIDKEIEELKSKK